MWLKAYVKVRLLFMHIYLYILVSTVAELIHNTGSISLSLSGGTDFMSEKLTLTLGLKTNKQTNNTKKKGFHDTS